MREAITGIRPLTVTREAMLKFAAGLAPGEAA